MERQNLCIKSRFFAILLIFFCSVATTSAAESYPSLRLNEQFTVQMFGDDVWTYTATKDGMIKIVGAFEDDYFGPCLDVYSDAGFSNKIDQFSYGPAHYEFMVTKDHTYYIRTNNFSQDIYAKLIAGEDFAFSGSNPGERGKFSVSGDAEVRLFFTSSNVTFTTGEMVCNGHEVKIYNIENHNELVQQGIITYTQEGLSGLGNYNGNVMAHSDNNGITIPFISATGKDFRNVFMEMLEDGRIETGMPMTLTMHGIRNKMNGELLNGDGELQLSFEVGGMPTKLESISLPSYIKSWHKAGDSAAKATFTFSREIKSAQALLEMGKVDENTDDLYTEDIDVIIDGRNVIVDLSGVLRNKSTMGLSGNWTAFTINLQQVVDIEGNATYSGGQGSSASYSFTIPYLETNDVPDPGNDDDDNSATLAQTRQIISNVNDIVRTANNTIFDGQKRVDMHGLETTLVSLQGLASSLKETGNKNEVSALTASANNIIAAAERLITLAEASVVTNADLNGDGKVTVTDYNKLLRMILTNENKNYDQANRIHVAADVNNTGNINMADITSLINILIHKVN